MNSKLPVGSVELCFKEDKLLSCLDDNSLAPALTKLHWRHEAVFDLDGGQPTLCLCKRCDRHQNIDHRDREASLDVSEVILEGRLRRELEHHPTDLKVSFFHGARGECCAIRRRLAIQKPFALSSTEGLGVTF